MSHALGCRDLKATAPSLCCTTAPLQALCWHRCARGLCEEVLHSYLDGRLQARVGAIHQLWHLGQWGQKKCGASFEGKQGLAASHPVWHSCASSCCVSHPLAIRPGRTCCPTIGRRQRSGGLGRAPSREQSPRLFLPLPAGVAGSTALLSRQNHRVARQLMVVIRQQGDTRVSRLCALSRYDAQKMCNDAYTLIQNCNVAGAHQAAW